MKKSELCDSEFDGDIGVVSRRGIINELLSNRYIFDTPIQRAFKTIRNYLFVAGIILLLSLSFTAIQRWILWDTIEKSTISAIYHGNKEQVEANKAKAFEKLQIAGASGDGRRR